MREILFRGKTDFDNWVYGEIFTWKGTTSIGDALCKFSVSTETVGQYTGLKDRNGKKIFEGDIVSFADCWDTQHKGVVCWCSGSYDVDCSKSDNEENKDFFRLFTAYACGAKIIGNIHDNLELLKD